ncbi:MAG: cupin domain-containing protein [Acutalibacteraceae bacterium]
MKQNETCRCSSVKDHGREPFVTDIDKETKQNENYRTALWTGQYLQLTLMSIPVGGEIGLEIHPDTDQFLRIESGCGMVVMGDKENRLDYRRPVSQGYAVFVPAKTWHNLINTGHCPIKLYSIYAPPHHPKGTVQPTKAVADREEHGHS